MNFQLLSEYPLWFIIFCLLLGALFSFLLYRKSQFNKTFFSFPNILMAVLRFLSISLISFFLLSPFIRKFFENIEKPIIVVAQDNSSSVLLGKDSSFYKDGFRKDVSKFIKDVSENYEVHQYTFGDEVLLDNLVDYQDKTTNISKLLDYLGSQYYNRNLGAIVLATDGIYNQGSDPEISTENLNVPIYCVAMGDTNSRTDLSIHKLKTNSIAYLGNKFPLQVVVKSQQLKSKKAKIEIFHDSKKIISEAFEIDRNEFYKEFSFLIEAKEKGLQHYIVKVTGFENEISLVNNSRNFFIEVLESKKKILILANSPHPDINFIKSSLSANENYSVLSINIADLNKKLPNLKDGLIKFDLVVFHQLPSTKHDISNSVKILEENKTPFLFVLGSQTNILKFNNLKTSLQITKNRQNFNEVLPIVNTDFSYFNTPDNLSDLIGDLPPLVAPYGNFQVLFESQSLLYQKIGTVNSQIPLFLFSQSIDQKQAFICGEGIYKWGLTEYKLNGNQLLTNDIIEKSIQFLTLQSDKRFLRLNDFKNEFIETENVLFDAELLNPSYEKQSNAEIDLIIKDKSGKSFTYKFQETDEGYELNAGRFKPGLYQYEIKSKINNNIFKLDGKFIVTKIDIEYLNHKADYDLLYRLSNKKEGGFYKADNLKLLSKDILENQELKPTSYFDQDTKDLINFKWLFFVILALLSSEWFFRKFFGQY